MSYTRRTELTCTQSELTTYADKVLLANELLAVVKTSGRRDIYYGDGTTPISGLSPSVSYDALNALKTAAETAKTAAATSASNAASSAQAAANSAASLVVVNDLVTGGTDKALSAEQGRVLSASISELNADVDFNVTNLVTNGDFSNGTTGWSIQYAAASVGNNILSVTGDGSSPSVIAYQLSGLAPTEGKKIYVKCKSKATNSNCAGLYLQALPNTSGAAVTMAFQLNPAANTQYNLGGILTIPSGWAGNVRFRATSSYADAATALGKTMEVQYAFAIDLTAAFGAGNEPTKAEMDAILAFYPNSWFNGTVNLASNPKMLPYLLNQTRNRPIMTTGTYAARPTSVVFPTLYLSTDKAAGNADRLTLNIGGITWLQI